MDESVGRGEAIARRENVASNSVEVVRILSEDVNVKYFLRIAEAKMLQLGVETGILGSEIWDAKGGGNTSASEDYDIPGLLDEIYGIIDTVVQWKLDPLG